MKPLILYSRSDALLDRWRDAVGEDHIEARSEALLMKACENITDGLILMDISTISKEVTPLLERITADERLKIFALTGTPDFDEGIKLLRHNVKGYGNAYMAKSHLRSAIEAIEDNKIWLYPELVQHLILFSIAVKPVPGLKNTALLTPKELEAANFIAKGLTNKEVAAHMQITERTVKAHLTAIYAKLGLNDRLSLALYLRGHDV